jgi:cephalosporin hydroxylase
MSSERDFVQSLSNFLALHTQQSPGYFNHLIESFMRGANPPSDLEPSAKDEIKRRLKTEMEAQDNVPSFLQYYLLRRLTQNDWTPQATFIASRYVRRRSGERFIAWQRRQQLVSELDGEPIRGSELGHRQLLYSQGAGSAFRWRGVPCFKTVYDLAIYAMLIDELHPRTIIELGSGAGGSALLFADLCTSAGLTTQIISIDNAAVEDISDPRIAFIRSDCSDWLAATAKSKRDFPRPCLLVEDFHGDLAGFFEHMDLILEAGDYLVIEDSNPKQSQISKVIADRPYLVDSKYTDFFGMNCTSAINSIFVKDTDKSAPQLRARQERQLLREQDRAWRQRHKRET